jgi:thiamine transporter ThiT
VELSDCFYEKVIKVKADVAALLIFFSDIGVTSRVAWRVVKGAVFWGCAT